MLEHLFWLLEFKFRFEFICLNPFLKPKPQMPKPSTFIKLILHHPAHQAAAARLRTSPNQQAPAQQPRRPRSPPSAAAAGVSGPAGPLSPPPRPVPLTGGTPVSSPSSSSSPTRTHLRRRHRVRPRPASPLQLGPHAKAAPLAYLSAPPHPGPPTRAV
jgi:hypothetical protein